MFITKDYAALETYLDVRNVSKNLLIRTDESAVNAIINEFPNIGQTIIDDDMSYFKGGDMYELDETGSGGGSSGGGYLPPVSAEPYEPFIANLQPCDSESGLFGNLFGENKKCIDKYESDRRVKTKAFNYNYFLAYHIGVKVKHQKKGWTGIWRKQDADEIGLIVENAIFKYDFTSIIGATLANLNQSQTFISPDMIIPSSNRGYYEVHSGMNAYSPVSFDYVSTSPYPFPIFNDDIVIEAWGNNSIVEWAVNQGNNLITRDKLNEYVWGTVYDKSKSFLRDNTTSSNYELPNNRTVLSKHTIGELWVHKSSKEFKINSAKVSETYDWGVGISISLNVSNGFSLSQANISPYNPQNPEAFGVRLYGIARKNGEWHGSLLQF